MATSGSGTPPTPQQVQLQGKWLEDLNIPVLFSNAFSVSPVNNEFILTFACMIPPVIPPELTATELQALTVHVKPLVRIGMTPDRILELIQLLQSQLKSYSDTIKS